MIINIPLLGPVSFGRPPKHIDPTKMPRPDSIVPPARSSVPESSSGVEFTIDNKKLLKAGFDRNFIPLIRNLSKCNGPISLAVQDLVQLSNTGWTIKFDRGVTPEQALKMRQHIDNKAKQWAQGVAGLDGLINKSFSQLFIAGAISNEWVPSRNLDGIDRLIFVNPENIWAELNERINRYDYHQRVKNPVNQTKADTYIMPKKLNPNTFRYFALNGDSDEPYGYPPFLAALEDISVQKDMKKNIAHIVKQLGVLGFMELLISKPSQFRNENDSAYRSRLTKILQTTKENVTHSVADGIMVGYDEDHKFNFHSIAKNVGGLSDIYNLNEIQIANGLKHHPMFFSAGNGNSETQINIVFTKVLSQLKNVQNIIKENYQYGITLELLMAGFKFKSVELLFNPSTITDSLKIEQSKEIKIRNLDNLYAAGIISQETYAEEMGYDFADQEDRRAPFAGVKSEDPEADKKKEDGKDASDRKGRDKAKPQPKSKPQDTRVR